MKVNPKRVRIIKEGEAGAGPVVYWMSRDQRVRDNWALLHTLELAEKRDAVVIFCLVPEFLGAAFRQYDFMLKGLREVEEGLAAKNIPFHILSGDPAREVPEFLGRVGAGALVTDFDPLRTKRRWKEQVKKEVSVPFHEVDAHNIVPCWEASSKREYAAYTFRPKISSGLEEFLESFPYVLKRPPVKRHRNDWRALADSLKVDRGVKKAGWIQPGEKAARRALRRFKSREDGYAAHSNDPNAEALSGLSPYLHFGQISAQRVALETSSEEFLEELIVRRELSDNFCFYEERYDSTECFPDWAKKTLSKHAQDRREYIYSVDEFESAATHDPLWNAAQTQMVEKGKMHSYLRMYWAKKIMEWTASPEEAMKTAIYLNDRYELDGRDPNGYAGIAWSIGGVHDRAWGERKVFGKIRYMSYRGSRSKFDVDRFVSRYRKG